MTYCISDIHGEYELFLRLLEKIGFSETDKLFVLGDMIDKGDHSVRLVKHIRDMPNAECIIGNHELGLIKRYRYCKYSGMSDEEILQTLQGDFRSCDDALDISIVEWIDALPSYIETDDFICVHAGIALGPQNQLYPLSYMPVEQLVHDRSFKEPSVVVNDSKCVLFGHTPTWHISGKPNIIAYPRGGRQGSRDIRDHYKVHLDTGVYETGVLGIFCVDTCESAYVSKPIARKIKGLSYE